MDHPVMSGRKAFWEEAQLRGIISLEMTLDTLKETAVDVNREFADKLGISASHAVTCVKPSGTVSQLVGCSSGIHPSFSDHYVRTVRQDIKDPVTDFLIDQGVPHELDVTNSNTMVFSFPIKATEGAVTEMTAMEQLHLYHTYKKHWCEHNPSISVYYTDKDFLTIGAWIYDNWDDYIGVSLMPKADHIYQQAPYTKITEREYDDAVGTFPAIDWDRLPDFEKEDHTTGIQDLACTAGMCEII
jgi:ribonucleoside-diphosphate reductase alpha chain